jgi:hypothetical protein
MEELIRRSPKVQILNVDCVMLALATLKKTSQQRF